MLVGLPEGSRSSGLEDISSGFDGGAALSVLIGLAEGVRPSGLGGGVAALALVCLPEGSWSLCSEGWAVSPYGGGVGRGVPFLGP